MRLKQQHHHEEHEWHDVTDPAAQRDVQVPGGEGLEDADDDPANGRTDDGVEPADDRHREGLEAERREEHADALDAREEHAADGRDEGSHDP